MLVVPDISRRRASDSRRKTNREVHPSFLTLRHDRCFLPTARSPDAAVHRIADFARVRKVAERQPVPKGMRAQDQARRRG